MKKRIFLLAILLAILVWAVPGLHIYNFASGKVNVASIETGSPLTSGSGDTKVDEDKYQQWATSTIMASRAWEFTTGVPEIIIAVLDTGIDEGHEDLAGQVIGSANFSGSDTTGDVYGHGTHIAGIIAAKNNGLGITGIAYNCKLLNVKVADDGGWCSASSIAKGIYWAVDHGAKVINISLYVNEDEADLKGAVEYALSKGALIITATGNGTGDKITFPAGYAGCIAVSATDPVDHITSWSGRGSWVDIAAPGADILSTVPGNVYKAKSGTSMASAYVSSVAALLYSVKQGAGSAVNSEIRKILEENADPLTGSAFGRVNAFTAMLSYMNGEGKSVELVSN